MSPVADQLEPRDECVHLVQITDTHLNRVEGGTLLGLNTDFSLQQVVDLVRRERPVIDLVLGTGDISDHGAKTAYERAAGYFNQLGAPVLWLAGNHDLAGEMAEVLGAGWQAALLRRGRQLANYYAEFPDSRGS